MSEDTIGAGIKVVHPEKQDMFIHSEIVANANLELLRRQNHCDVIFVVGPEEKTMKCHKTFLISRSPVFQTMFSEMWERPDPIGLPDIEPETFQLFLEFVYGDVFTTDVRFAMKVLQLGHKYDVQPLVKKCEELISKNIQLKDAIEIFTVARRYSLQKLMDQVADLMAGNFEDLSGHENFRYIDEETLIYLLQKDDLCLEELKVFNILMSWAALHVTRPSWVSGNMVVKCSYSEILKNVIPLVRFPIMTAKEFATHIVHTQILPQKDVIDLFVYFNSEESVREDVAKRIQFSAVPRKKPITLSVCEKAPSLPVIRNNFYERW